MVDVFSKTLGTLLQNLKHMQTLHNHITHTKSLSAQELHRDGQSIINPWMVHQIILESTLLGLSKEVFMESPYITIKIHNRVSRKAQRLDR